MRLQRFEVQGIKELEKAFRAYQKETGKAYASRLGEVSRQILKDALDITPIDTGALRASGDYFITGRGWDAVAVIGFGFPVSGYFKFNRERVPAEYAVYQHDAPYEVKFLERAVEINEDAVGYLTWEAIASI
jgi:hypothetical protein